MNNLERIKSSINGILCIQCIQSNDVKNYDEKHMKWAFHFVNEALTHLEALEKKMKDKVLVPLEPTFDMTHEGSQETLDKYDGTCGKANRIYKAMIEAGVDHG